MSLQLLPSISFPASITSAFLPQSAFASSDLALAALSAFAVAVRESAAVAAIAGRATGLAVVTVRAVAAGFNLLSLSFAITE